MLLTFQRNKIDVVCALQKNMIVTYLSSQLVVAGGTVYNAGNIITTLSATPPSQQSDSAERGKRPDEEKNRGSVLHRYLVWVTYLVHTYIP